MKEQRVLAKRVKTPSVLQMEAVECGAAALAMVMGYYGLYLPLENLRVECGVSRDGSKASNILKAARKYGLDAKGFRKDPEDLKYMKGPMILHWSFNHFVVYEGMKGNKIYLNDPANGPRIVNWEEFDREFTGIVLTFEPTKDFKKGGKPKSIFTSLGRRFIGIKMALTYIIIAGLALVIPGLVIPTFSKIFIDKIILNNLSNWLWPLLIGLLLTGLLRSALNYLQRYYLLRLETKISVTTSSKFFWHVLKLPIEFFYQRFAGEISSRVAINEEVAEVLSGELATIFLDLFMVLFYAVLMIQYSPLLTLIGVVTALLNIATLRFLSKKRATESTKMLQEGGKLSSISISGIRMIETIKASGSEVGFFSKWAGHHAKMINFEQELGESGAFMSIVPSFLTTVNSVILLSVGSLEVLRGNMSVGMLIAFQSLMASFIDPVNSLVSFGGRLQELKGNMDRLDDVQDHKIDSQFEVVDLSEEKIKNTTKVKLEGYIELKDITFGYNLLEEPLIENFNLKLEPGSRVALVGMSGSGKSTVSKVVSGLYKPWSGQILFDGVSRKEIPRSILNNSIGVVDQEIIMFEGSVKDNIRLWDESVDESDIIQAAKDADIHQAIVDRKEGYDFKISESGSGFSGGQLQRIEIARALVTNPRILILDEATSALDTKTEQIIDNNIRRRGCTCIIVAHRLSTIRDADEIIVLDRGKVVERGTHDELKKAKGLYSTLISST